MIKKIFLILVFMFMFLPIYFMLLGSFQTAITAVKMPPDLWVNEITFIHYIKIFSLNISVWLVNSIVVMVGIVFLSVFVSCSGGYVFSFYSFKFKEIIWPFFLVGMMIPRISILIPTFVIIRKLGLSGSLLAIILPVVFSPLGLFLARNYFDGIPKSLLESARLDGASEIGILTKIVMPISLPLVSLLSVFAGIYALQDYIWQALVLQVSNKQTMIVGLIRYTMLRGGAEGVNNVGRGMAVGIVLLVPLLIIFIFANKYFVNNISGAIKE